MKKGTKILLTAIPIIVVGGIGFAVYRLAQDIAMATAMTFLTGLPYGSVRRKKET
jgi:hypothetical protein